MTTQLKSGTFPEPLRSIPMLVEWVELTIGLDGHAAHVLTKLQGEKLPHVSGTPKFGGDGCGTERSTPPDIRDGK
jgi:hypothetical protein